MRNNVFKAASAALLLVTGLTLNCSCSKVDTPKTEYEATFYLGVNPSDAACVYKDNELLYKLDRNSWISGLAVMPDGCIYACGNITVPTEKAGTEISIPAIWKDGKRIPLDLEAIEFSNMANMIVNGDNWLCCGTLKDAEGEYGIIIKNGKVVYRSQSNVYFQCMDCGASGDCYVVAKEGKELSLCRISSDTWEITSVDHIATDDDEYFWLSNCIHVGNTDIAIGLDKNNGSTFESDAFCWLNNGRGLLNIGDNSSVYDITFCNGYVVAGGCNETVTRTQDYPEIKTEAVQWVDGEPQIFSHGCTGSSAVVLLKNWNDMFLFQGVKHDGGIQICNNGTLLEEIRFNENPNLNCWDVVVKKLSL